MKGFIAGLILGVSVMAPTLAYSDDASQILYELRSIRSELSDIATYTRRIYNNM